MASLFGDESDGNGSVAFSCEGDIDGSVRHVR